MSQSPRKNLSKSRDDLIQSHLAQCQLASSLPAAFAYFNPLEFKSIHISDLDYFTQSSRSVLYVKSITPPNICPSSVSSIIEDSKGEACKISLLFSAIFPINSMLAIFEPTLILKDGTSTIEIADEKGLGIFTDEQEFRNTGWGQKMPPGFGSEHYKAQALNLLEQKMYKEALRKFSIAMNYNPQNTDVIIGLLNCYMGLGDTDNALAVSKRALELSPNNLTAVKIRAKCLVETNRIQEAKMLIDNSKANDINLETMLEDKGKKIARCNRTRLSRLKEIVLVEWPKLVSIEKIKKKLTDEGVHADRVSIRGKTAILIYDTVENREEARLKLLELEDSEFMMANEPAMYE